MKPKLILHVGCPKCGSSSIQSFLLQNQQALRDRGTVIINQKFEHPGSETAQSVAQVTLGRLLPTKGAKEQIKSALRDIHHAMDQHNDSSCVISSESLTNTTEYAEYFSDAKDLFEVEVVAYVRPQQSWLPSAWKQYGLRDGESLEAFIDRHMQAGSPNFLRRLLPWEKVFGRDAMRVNSMRKQRLKNGDLVTDFCHLLDWNMDGLNPPVTGTMENTSFDHDILTVLSYAHQVLEGNNTGRIFNYLQRNLPKAAIEQGRVGLSGERQAEIIQYFSALNQNFCRQYFNSCPVEEAFGSEQDIKARNSSLDDRVAVARTVAYLIAMGKNQDEKIRALEQRLSRLEQTIAN